MNNRLPGPSKRRRRKWRFSKKHRAFKWILILLFLAAAVVLAVTIFSGDTSEPVKAMQEDPVETPALTPTPSATVEYTPTATPFQKKAAEGYLILVNWETPLASEERPGGLVTMDKVFDKDLVLFNEEGSVNEEVGMAANEMFKAAKEEGIGKYIVTSAYRCVSYQETFYNEKINEDPDYGKDPYANPVSIMPGNCTEHATGLALDILSVNYNETDEGYADTDEAEWLRDNAYKFGFILRYPKDKTNITGVVFEPWHYRYVGAQAATEMYENGLCLEEYVYVP